MRPPPVLHCTGSPRMGRQNWLSLTVSVPKKRKPTPVSPWRCGSLLRKVILLTVVLAGVSPFLQPTRADTLQDALRLWDEIRAETATKYQVKQVVKILEPMAASGVLKDAKLGASLSALVDCYDRIGDVRNRNQCLVRLIRTLDDEAKAGRLYEEAIGFLNTFAARHLFDEGVDAQEVLEWLTPLLAATSPLATDRTLRDVVNAALHSNLFETAEKAGTRFLREYPASVWKTEVLLKMGLIQCIKANEKRVQSERRTSAGRVGVRFISWERNEEMLRSAAAYFQEVIAIAPETPEGRCARAYLEWVESILAVLKSTPQQQ